MNLEQYKKWLEENANKEERQAYNVAEEIIYHHAYNRYTDYKIDIFPRKKFNGIEFDLLIYIWIQSKNPKNRTYRDALIGVEFKETDLEKVIQQAIVRKEFVDYIYIATNCRAWKIEQLFLMALYGIGWIFWDNRFVKMILEPRRDKSKVEILLDYLFNKKLEEVIGNAIERKLKDRRLDEWSE